MFLLLALACSSNPDPSPSGAEGLLGTDLMAPFPSRHLLDEDGHLALPSIGDLDPPLPTELLAWRTGFSPAQVIVARLDQVDSSALPSWHSSSPGQGGVRLFDRTDGSWLPVMAELDANEQYGPPALLIRPLIGLADGHEITVAITTAVTPRTTRFDDLLRGDPVPGLAGWSDHYNTLLDELDAAGLPGSEVALAWDFPISSGTRPLATALEAAVPTGDYRVTLEKHADRGDLLAVGGWRYFEGQFTTPRFLADDSNLPQLDDQGNVSANGNLEADFYVYLPASIADAPAQSVPVLVFGHGMGAKPDDELDAPGSNNFLVRIADSLGVVVVATRWRALDYYDRLIAIEIAGDFGRFPELPGLLIQGQADTRSLLALVHGALADDPLLQGNDGQALIDPDRTYYYGLSMGSIEGVVFLGAGADIDAAVLHVPGAAWSTMLERSRNWPVFEIGVLQDMPDPFVRQQFYALSQLWWDPVDPIPWAPALAGGPPLLLQESIGDDAVSNLTTEMLARSLGVTELSPYVSAISSLDTAPANLPPGSSALVQFDPEQPIPLDINRPAVATGAHDDVLGWSGARLQAIDFLTPGSEGQVHHYCGAGVCSASNPGP